MTWLEGARSLLAEPAGSVVAIGNFDGVHLGHQAVVNHAIARARVRGISALAFTFHPHPAEVLSKAKVAYLTRLERKAELLQRLDAELRVVVERFDENFSRLTARDFAQEYLHQLLGAREVVVGENFRFGRDGAGKLGDLRSLGENLGFEVRVESLTRADNEAVSSSRIREFLRRGDVERAQSLLSRPHALSGTVVRGQQLGRTLGFPTANLAGVIEQLPASGIYSCLVDRQPANAEHSPFTALALGALSVGTRPTIGAGELTVEVYLLDFAGDLYGERLRVHLIQHLRPEKAFDSLDALRNAIDADVNEARTRLQGWSPDPNARGAWA